MTLTLDIRRFVACLVLSRYLVSNLSVGYQVHPSLRNRSCG
jgi:hypothetical protein